MGSPLVNWRHCPGGRAPLLVWALRLPSRRCNCSQARCCKGRQGRNTRRSSVLPSLPRGRRFRSPPRLPDGGTACQPALKSLCGLPRSAGFRPPVHWASVTSLARRSAGCRRRQMRWRRRSWWSPREQRSPPVPGIGTGCESILPRCCERRVVRWSGDQPDCGNLRHFSGSQASCRTLTAEGFRRSFSHAQLLEVLDKLRRSDASRAFVSIESPHSFREASLLQALSEGRA
jgi:hypothetical protein